MDFADSVKWGMYDRLLAWAAFAVGALIITIGVWYGAGNTVGELGAILGGGTAPAPRSLPVAIGGIVLGVFVWQLGAVIARYHALTTATSQELAEEFDTERVKSELLTVVDERVGEMEHDINRLRRQIEALDDGETDGFSFENELDEPRDK